MNKYIPLALPLALTLAAATHVFAAPPPDTPVQVAQASAEATRQGENYDWVYEKWTGNDAPFRRIRDEIDDAIARGSDPNALAKAAAKPGDAKAQFRRIYAEFRAAQRAETTAEFEKRMGKIHRALKNTAFPNNYEFIRLRFIAHSYIAPLIQLAEIGEKLMQRAPDDFEVKYRYILWLEMASDDAYKARALKYAADLIRQKPDRPEGYEARGWIYYHRWSDARKPEDARRALEVYRACRERTGTYRYLRPICDERIAELQKAAGK